MTTLRERVRSGSLLLGTFLNLGSPLVAEVCALNGFDWLLVDLEHGTGGEEALVGQLLAGAAHGVPVIARTESAERIRAGHVLDLGAEGVMFPRLDTREQVVEALSHLWYPPRGDRGVAGYNRARQFGADVRTSDEVNDSILGVVQIESRTALENVEEIAGLVGVDVLFVGPSDLSTSLEVPGQLDAPVFVEALDRVVAAARANGVAAGILVGDPARVGWHHERGYSFVAIGSDSALLRSGVRAALDLRPNSGVKS
jgi:2-dehydro-3-deoxyglucarate aldolase/4-hydroxy-2-oxoheptanedioate aldolase